MSDDHEKKPYITAMTDIEHGQYLRFISYKSKAEIRQEIRFRLLWSRGALIVLSLICIIGILWAILTYLL